MPPPLPGQQPDYQDIFHASPGCYLVLARDLTIIAVTDAYLRATLTTRDQLLGRRLFEAFPDNPDDPTATGVQNLRNSLERVLRDRRPDAMAVQKYDIRRPEADGGGFEERHWSPVNSPVLGSDGEVSCIIHHVEDVTHLVRLQQRGSEQERTIRELSIRGEERLSQVLDAAPDAMVVVDAESRIRFVNAQTENLFGYSPLELLGQPLEILVPTSFRAGHGLHVRRYFQKPTTRTMGSGLELFGQRKDGTQFPIEVSLSPLAIDGGMAVTAAIRDTTERKRLMEAASLGAARLASAVESTQDAFAIFDAADRLVLCNSVYRRLLAGVLQGAILGHPYETLLDAWLAELEFSSDEERTRFRRDRLSSRGEPKLEYNVRASDGRTLRVAARRTPDGGIVETIWDLTEDARIAAELREAREAADKANAAKSEFLSSMSHELRTPLNAILGFAQLMQRDKKSRLPDTHHGRLAQIMKGGEHLLRLIDDILDLSRIEAGGVSVSLEPVDVLEVLKELLVTLGPSAAEADVRLELTATSPDVPMIGVDRTRFAQILMNFGSNAIKYNRPGGVVTFTVSVPASDRVRVTVSDTGMGIPKDKQSTVFQAFQRAGQEAGPIEGTGIGLAITKRLVELMKGSLGFRSTHGEGSEFWTELPAHGSKRRSSVPPQFVEEVTRRLQLEGPAIILYVEDNPANVSFMEDLVGELGNLELLVARTAEAGIEIARAHRPAAIILDINLPGMSGLDALRVLRDQSETAGIPVIALSAAATERDRQRGERAGFHRYLTKPLKISELEAALETALSA
jgi:PAS domain S-box-containing protein